MSLKQRRNFGWIPQLPDHRDRMLAMPGDGATIDSLPASIDLTTRHKFNVLDQGQLGSCVAHAVSSAIEYAQAIRDGNPDTPKKVLLERQAPASRLFLYYEARRAMGTLGEDSGCAIRDAMRVAYNIGAARESGWKYLEAKFKNEPPKRSYKSAPFHKITSYQAVPVSVLGVKAALAQGFPVMFGLTVYSSFMDAKADIPMPTLTEESVGGHAMLAVGYDDATSRFKFLNSWGASWGNEGYGTIPYQYLGNRMLGDDYWTLQDNQYKERM